MSCLLALLGAYCPPGYWRAATVIGREKCGSVRLLVCPSVRPSVRPSFDMARLTSSVKTKMFHGGPSIADCPVTFLSASLYVSKRGAY